MVAEQNASIANFTENGFAVLHAAIDPSLVASVMPAACNDAKDVPIDPHGGLPWAYDVYPEEYEPLTKHARELLVNLGAISSKIHRVTLIKKLPGEERRFWHADKEGPRNGRTPMEILVLYYLTGTMDDNGCLLVRPGYVSGPKHEDLDRFCRADEFAVPVEIGDVILMDPRLQHASLPNNSDTERLLIRIWTVNQW